MAQRALDRRLTDELMRFKNTIAILTRSATIPLLILAVPSVPPLCPPLSHLCIHLCPTFVFTSVPPLCSHLSHFCAHLCPTFVLTSIPLLCSPLSHILCSPLSHLCAHLCPTFILTSVPPLCLPCPIFVLTSVPPFAFTSVSPLCLHLSRHCNSFCVHLHFVILWCVYLFNFYTFIYCTILILFYYIHFYDHLLMQILKNQSLCSCKCAAVLCAVIPSLCFPICSVCSPLFHHLLMCSLLYHQAELSSHMSQHILYLEATGHKLCLWAD